MMPEDRLARIAYLDCFAGISGDMLLGALLDSGLEIEALRAELAHLKLDGWSIRSERVSRSGIAATKAHVDLAEAPQPHRRLPDILTLLDQSTLGDGDKRRASGVFERLANA